MIQEARTKKQALIEKDKNNKLLDIYYYPHMEDIFYDIKKKIEKLFFEYGKIILVSFFILCISLFLFLIISFTFPKKLKVSFLDVRQGDAIFVETPSGKQMLIDGGSTHLILERLSKEISYFDRDIDVVIATHPDADHITGLIPVLEKYNVHTIITSPVSGYTDVFEDLDIHIQNEEADVYVAHGGDVIDFGDGVIAKILYPPQKYIPKKNDTNDASVSVVIMYGDQSFLLTGDLPSTEEVRLISPNLPKHITVYKAGHHGSKNSSSEQLLSYIHPEYTIISAGKDNTYGHPHFETIERLQKYTKEILSTIERGTISFMTDGRIVEVETEK